MADGKLFKAFADTSPYPSMPAPEPGGPMAEMGELMRMDAELDDPENLEPEAQRHRLQEPDIQYIELKESTGAVGCGECKSLVTDSFCANPRVMAYVSAEHGVCNHFDPSDHGIVDPHDWEAGRAPTGDEDDED